ncbi:MAG: hypothetical protein ACFFE4_09730 [Candidatus Thorarchaeota archaeon]
MLSFKIQWIIDSLESGDIKKLRRALYNFADVNSIQELEMELDETTNFKLEHNYYSALSALLESKRFEQFKQLLNYSVDLDIFIDVLKIPNRFEHLFNIQINGIRGGQIGDIFKVIRIFNEYNLLAREIPHESHKFIEEIKKDKLIIRNLKDLFGKVSDALIFHVYDTMLKNILELFKSSAYTEEGNDFFYNEERLMSFFNNYTIYGLSVGNLGTVEEFLNSFQEQHSFLKAQKSDGHDEKFIEIEFRNRTHLVSIINIEKNLDKFISAKEHYNFYNLSMVLLGGLGPEGHGFTYSTPKGEIIEICSDRRETRAIIIKYKEFLKQQFLSKLNIEFKSVNISKDVKEKVLEFLSNILKPKEIVNYFKVKVIIKQISEFLSQIQNFPDFQGKAPKQLLVKITKAINIILRPIMMIDQFKCRMNLIEQGDIKSEDIAKLTSLRDKSHYDVLRERFFFQNQIKWLFKLYSKEILSFQKRRKKRF